MVTLTLSLQFAGGLAALALPLALALNTVFMTPSPASQLMLHTLISEKHLSSNCIWLCRLGDRVEISTATVLEALQRNFGGVPAASCHRISGAPAQGLRAPQVS